jgi:hypothetical protein
MFFRGIQGSNYEEKVVDLREYGLLNENLDIVAKRAIDEMLNS